VAAELELESLLVRLLGDASGYIGMLTQAAAATKDVSEQLEGQTTQATEAVSKAMNGVVDATNQVQPAMQQAQAATKDATKAAEENAEKVKTLGERLQGFAKSAAGALGTIGISLGFWKAFEKADAAEKSMARLTATLETNGRQVQATLKDYGDFAAQMANVTLQSKGTVRGLLLTAETFGITGREAKKAVQDAIALATVNEGSADSFIRISAAMARGDIGMAMMMARLVPQLRGVKDESEFVAKYQNLIATGMKQAADETGTASGQMEKMKQSLGGVTTEIGKIILAGLSPLVTAVKDTVDWINSLNGPVRTVIMTLLALTATIVPLLGMFALFKTVVGVLVGTELVAAVGVFGALKGAIVSWAVAAQASFAAFMANPIGLAIAGIAVAVALFVAMGGSVKDALTQVGDAAKTAFAPAIALLRGFIGVLVGAWNMLKPAVLAVGAALQTATGWIVQAVGWLIKLFEPIYEVIKVAAEFVGGMAGMGAVIGLVIAGVALAIPLIWNLVAATIAWTIAFLASPAGMIAGGIMLGAAAFKYLGGAIMSLIPGWSDLNREMARSVQLSKDLKEAQEKSLKALPARLGGMDPKARREALEAELKSINATIEAQQRARTSAVAFLESYSIFTVGPGSRGKKEREQDIADVDQRLKISKDRAELLQKELDKFKISPELLSKLQEMKEGLDLKEQTEGMSETAAEIAKLTKGLTPEQRTEIGPKVDELLAKDAESRVRALDSAVTDLVVKMREEADVFGMDSREAEIHKLALQGATEAQLEQARALAEAAKQRELAQTASETIAALNLQGDTMLMTAQQAELYKLAIKGLADEQLDAVHASQLYVEGQESLKKIKEVAEALTQEMRTPMEVFDDRVMELNELLDRGAITLETYARAIEKAAGDANRLNRELKAVQGAAAGSAEALDRYNAYQSQLYGGPFGRGPVKGVEGRLGSGLPVAEVQRQAEQAKTIAAAAGNPDRGPVAPAGGQVTAVQNNPPQPGGADRDPVVRLLTDIRDILSGREKKPVVELRPAGIR
jgi:hypothetical protein